MAAVSYEGRVIMETLGFVFCAGSICLFGIFSNAINIVVFIKQGLDTTINISFFALAVSDLISVISLYWCSICINPLVINANDISMYTPETQYLTGAWPHACFGHITCWITAYMTAERYFCIAFPLQVKQILTPRKTSLVMCVMYGINIASFIPEYTSTYFDWKYFPERNRSLLALAFTENRPHMQGIGFIMHAALGMVSFPGVILFTVILIVKLKQQSTWRKKTTRTQSKHLDTTTKRNIKTIKMVVLIAIILIACYIPGVAASLAIYFVPGFNIVGTQVNLFFSVWGFLFSLEAVNSSVNIFLYYKMSTKYRNSFNEIFGKCKKGEIDSISREVNVGRPRLLNVYTTSSVD